MIGVQWMKIASFSDNSTLNGCKRQKYMIELNSTDRSVRQLCLAALSRCTTVDFNNGPSVQQPN